MDQNYISNPAVKLLADQIEPGCTEAEVQRLWDNILWTTYPASKLWTTASRHRNGAVEPDNVVSKVVEFGTGWAMMDLLMVELKRPQERISRRQFDDNVNNYLDDFMAESANPGGSILFGAVGIGLYVQFYSRVLPRGNITPMHDNPLHLIDNAQAVQQQFEYFKVNVPRGQYVPNPAAVMPAAVVPEPEPYYYRLGKKYYHSSSNAPLKECPTNVWVRDDLGWNTGGGKKWRWRYPDMSHAYRDDE